MSRILLIPMWSILIFTVNTSPIKAAQDERPVKAFAYDSFKLVLSNSLDMNQRGNFKDQIADPSGLILLLAEIDTSEARNLLIEIVEVKLSPVHSEALDYALTRQSKKIYSGLKEMLSKPVSCSFLKNSLDETNATKLQCQSLQDRNRYIQSILKYIDSGKRIEYVL